MSREKNLKSAIGRSGFLAGVRDDWRGGREIKSFFSFFSVDLLEGMKKNVECQTILPVGGEVTDVHIAVSVIDHRNKEPTSLPWSVNYIDFN